MAVQDKGYLSMKNNLRSEVPGVAAATALLFLLLLGNICVFGLRELRFDLLNALSAVLAAIFSGLFWIRSAWTPKNVSANAAAAGLSGVAAAFATGKTLFDLSVETPVVWWFSTLFYIMGLVIAVLLIRQMCLGSAQEE
jgi:hypothetical protein